MCSLVEHEVEASFLCNGKYLRFASDSFKDLKNDKIWKQRIHSIKIGSKRNKSTQQGTKYISLSTGLLEINN